MFVLWTKRSQQWKNHSVSISIKQKTSPSKSLESEINSINSSVSIIHSEWLQKCSEFQVTTSKYFINQFEGNAAKNYIRNMPELLKAWCDHSSISAEVAFSWKSIIDDINIIYDFLTNVKDMLDKDSIKSVRSTFYGFSQKLWNFVGGNFPTSSGATKVHYLHHVYDQIEFWGCQTRWIDESGLELFHQIIKKSDELSKRCRSWRIRE